MFSLLLFGVWGASLNAQQTIVTGRIVDFNSGEAISGAEVFIQGSSLSDQSDLNGLFSMSGSLLPQGDQVLLVRKQDYLTLRIPIIIEANSRVHLDPILMELDLNALESQIGIISLSDTELNQDEAISDNISGLLQASKDVFFRAAAFDFSAAFFRPRGLDNANGKVLINGIEMNKQFNGRPQWANWGGLNDVQRNQEFSMGLTPNEYTFGDIAGTTNMVMRASQYRTGGRLSYAFANRSYQGRVMATYHSGLTKSGWAYSFSASRRFGQQGFVAGTLYDANSFFLSVEKKLNAQHSLNFTGFYTPNRRGRSTAITQEVKDLKGRAYNPNWGWQEGVIRNSRIREVKEPVLMLNHFWDISEHTRLNTNIALQMGSIGNTRIDNGGTRLVMTPDGQESFIGGARNPFGNYYQRLPSFFLQNPNPTPNDYQNAFVAQQQLVQDGQLNWNQLYRANTLARERGGNAIYVIQEDRNDDTQLSVSMVLSTRMNDHITLNTSVSYRNLTSENFANLKDLLGGTGYLDVDFFAQDDVNTIVGDVAQSDLRNRNRIVQEGQRYKYNYILNAAVIDGFAQLQFKYKLFEFYLGASLSQTSYQRSGLFENGNFPGQRSLGNSEVLNFMGFGAKGGITYKLSGRHLVDVNLGYLTKAPGFRNAFSNARQNNDVVIGMDEEKIQNLDISYIYRSPIVKARLTGFYNTIQDQADIGFYFTENLSGLGFEQDAFVQEIVTGMDTRRMGVEFGIEAQLTPTINLKAAASLGQYVFTNNPNLYLTSDDFEGPLSFGNGTTQLQNYHVAAGPERAIQLGFEYRDPDFWWMGITANYLSDAYIDINNLARSANFSTDFDGTVFNDYQEDLARELLRQEKFDDYVLVNVIGGKSWQIKNYFVGFFATVNNVLDQEYITGGFEQGRLSNFQDLREDTARTNGRLFGPRYFFGNGTTYYLNFYVRF